MRILFGTALFVLVASCTGGSASSSAPSTERLSNGVIVNIPAGADFSVFGPEAEPVFKIEHFPLDNLVSWEVFINNGASTLTFTGGTGELFDEDGNSMTGPMPISVQLLNDVARWFPDPGYQPLSTLGLCAADNTIPCKNPGNPDPDRCPMGNDTCDPRPGAGYVPANGTLGVPFPFERVGHNVVPARADMSLCFAEFDLGGQCQPLEVLEVPLAEYRVPDGAPYIYPLGNPGGRCGADKTITCTTDAPCDAANSGDTCHLGTLWTGAGGGHEINTNHRMAGNQRYAYDVGVLIDNTDHEGSGGANSQWYAWDLDIVAMAAGDVVTLEKGHPDNPNPPDVLPGAGKCKSRRCDHDPMDSNCSLEVVSDPLDDIYPGSGNSFVIEHATGEFTAYAHMRKGSNQSYACYDSVSRAQVLGQVGNVGTTSAPHIHFSSLNKPAPEDPGAISLPMYFNNVMYPSNPGDTPRRQLDVAMPTYPNGLEWTIISTPTPLASNPPVGANESEPNDTLANHNTIAVGSTVAGSLEAADVGDLAVRGDGIEDVYRVDLSGADSLRFDLNGGNLDNLDIYVLNEELGVLNETHAGTSPGSIERICLELGAGSYYAMVTNVDDPGNQVVPYTLDVASDPLTLEVTVANGVSEVEVDQECESIVEFSLAIHDGCCLDPDNLGLVVSPSISSQNATIGALELDPPMVISERDLVVTGRVAVSDLTSCPAVLQIDAVAQDCSGNQVDTAIDGGADSVELVDRTPPMVAQSLATSLLWPPTHELIDVGFDVSATDTCAGEVTLSTQVFSDEPEVGGAGTMFAPDATDPDGMLRLRSERIANSDGRVYLMVSTAVDSCGNVGIGCISAAVPKSFSAAGLASVAAQAMSATAHCQANAGAPPPGFYLHGTSPARGPKQ